MNIDDLKKILQELAAGSISVADVMENMRAMPFSDIGIAKHDMHRPLRNGFAEVILCQGKMREHVLTIVEHAKSKGVRIFGTRADESLLDEIKNKYPGAETDAVSRTFLISNRPAEPLEGRLAIIAAGTADLSIAEEACRTAQFFGVEARRFYDVGVAGLHRILSCIDEIRQADVAIVVAGMEGALPSVVGGLIESPIVAVPTSVGYGASFGGLAALLGMLNSCSEGISVVNIDNGFGAACAAMRILRRLGRGQGTKR